METARTPSDAARWARIQALSGLVFSVFAVLHLTNTLFALGGPGAYDSVQRVLRLYYQNPLVEVVGLLGALGTHIVASVVRMRMRRTEGVRPASTRRMRLHRYAAYYLLVVIVGHVVATRGPQLVYGVAPGFAGLSYSLARYPYYFYPYYGLFAVLGVYHVCNGIVLALATLRVRVPTAVRKGPAGAIPLAVAATGLLLAILAIGGHFFPIHEPADNDFARLIIRFMGA